MKIKVNFYALFREMAGRKEFEIELNNNASIADLIEALKTQVNEQVYEKIKTFMQSNPSTLIMVNGRNIKFLDGLNTKISEKDKIDIFPPGAGG